MTMNQPDIGALYWTGGLYNPGIFNWVWDNDGSAILDNPPWTTGHPQNNTVNRIVMAYQNRFSSEWRTIQGTQLQRYICEA